MVEDGHRAAPRSPGKLLLVGGIASGRGDLTGRQLRSARRKVSSPGYTFISPKHNVEAEEPWTSGDCGALTLVISMDRR